MEPAIRTTRVKFGDRIRLYGYPCEFEVWATTSDVYDFHAKPMESRNSGFPALAASVVAINGRPVPCLSAPIAPPASDYPCPPQFEYTDAPQEFAFAAVDHWRRGL